MKINPILFIALFLLTLTIACTSDLRTDTAKEARNEAKAKTLLKEMAEAHGIDNWKNVSTYNATFEEEFLGLIGKQSHPYQESQSQFLLQYIPNTYDGRLTFLTGKNKGKTWGIQSWKTYTQEANENPVFKDDKDITFWLPTYQYFIEFPMRIQKANSFSYAGEAEIDGIDCEGIIASWNTTNPQKDIDQYLIWIDKSNKRIVKLEYTIREMYRFLTGAAYYKDYKDYNGILLPSYMPVESNLSKNFLHKMRIQDFSANQIAIETLRPNEELSVMGDDKE